MRVFLDANILFSAAKSNGAIRQLFTEIRALGHECAVDEYVVAEARRNLELKFKTSLHDFEGILGKVTRLPGPPADIGASLAPILPEKDRPVLASAIRYGCQALLTGDKAHFGHLFGKTIAGVSIQSPQGLAEFLAASAPRLNPRARGRRR